MNYMGLILTSQLKMGEFFEATKGQAVINYGAAGAGGILLDGEAPKIDFL